MHVILAVSDLRFAISEIPASRNPKSQIRNGHPDIRNGTFRNPKSQIRNGHPNIRNGTSRNPKSQIRNGHPDIRNGTFRNPKWIRD